MVSLTIYRILSGCPVGLGGYSVGIHPVHSSISPTAYWTLYVCFNRIRRTSIEYLFTVCIGQPDIISNIVWMLLLD